ncbi:MAG: HEAT repeat domain-containing protein [Pirellulaceae bacterium]
MRRALSLTRVPTLSERGRGMTRPDHETRPGNAEYVVNRSAIAAALLLLAVLMGVPAGVYALWPSLFATTDEAVPAGPVLVTVASEVQRVPPAPTENPALEALREKQLWEEEAKRVDHRDATRRAVRIRQGVTRERDPLQGSSSTDARPTVDVAAATTASPAVEIARQGETTASIVGSMRLNALPESELRHQLQEYVPEHRLDDQGEIAKNLIAAAVNRAKAESNKQKKESSNQLPDSSMLRKLVASREDLAGFPFRWDGGCQTQGERLATLKKVSTEIRSRSGRPSRSSFSSRISSGSAMEEIERLQSLTEKLNDEKLWRTPHHVPALEQMLLPESVTLSMSLVNAYAHIEGPEASRALARRALYELRPEVRVAAIEALRDRRPSDYLQVLAEGLQYPWEPVALNAADALIELAAKGAVPELLAALELPPPNRPYRDDQGRWVQRELVKVNHFRNCTLCHAPATRASADTLTGAVPLPGSPLPQVYYSGRSGVGLVRADITYLRQDFSLMQYVPDASPWPAMQRFDFLVRTRVLPPEQQEHFDAHPVTDRDSPQRDLLLRVLRQLTGRDGGNEPQRWRELLASDS